MFKVMLKKFKPFKSLETPQYIIKGLAVSNTGKCVCYVIATQCPFPPSLIGPRILNDACAAARKGTPLTIKRGQMGQWDGAWQDSQNVVEGSARALSLIDKRIKSTGAYMKGPHVNIHGN